MTIAGQTENLLVDTGGFVSSLTASAVNQLSLRHQAMPARAKVVMYGGLELRDMAVADEIGLGHMKGRHIGFLIMPDHQLPPEVSGTIGADIMKNYDVELDFAKAKFNLFSPDHCDGRLPYWTHDTYAQLPMRIDHNNHIRIPIRLDGKLFDAMLDTGSSRSMMRLENAKDAFGWDTKTTVLKIIAKTKGDGAPVSYNFPFKSLTFAGVTVADPDIVLVSDKVSDQYGQPDILVGMGILRQLHVYLAYQEGSLYLTSADAH
jgi:predicted aspartyl protease